MAEQLKVIAKSVSKGQQDVVYSETVETNGIKVKIEIRSDAYEFQSHAWAKAFSPTELKWNPLAELHYAAMKTPAKLTYKPDGAGLAESWFQADRNELLRQAREILV